MRKLKHDYWPYEIQLRLGKYDKIDEDIESWCGNTIGQRFKDWFSYSIEVDKRLYAFKDEQTLLLFKLKWGQYEIR